MQTEERATPAGFCFLTLSVAGVNTPAYGQSPLRGSDTPRRKMERKGKEERGKAEVCGLTPIRDSATPRKKGRGREKKNMTIRNRTTKFTKERESESP